PIRHKSCNDWRFRLANCTRKADTSVSRPACLGAVMKRFSLSLLSTLAFAVGAVADEPKPADQVRDQKDALAHAEQTARRITTSLRVMTYQKLDAGSEQKLLDEVASSLKGLTQDQIKAVLDHLEKAAKAPDESTATEEQKQAYQKHRQVVSTLR